MNDKKQKKDIGIILICVVIIIIGLVVAWSSPNENQTSTVPVYTAENCIHDLAIRNANEVKKDMDNGVPFSDTKESNRLNEYERQKVECYKNYK